MFGGSSKLGRGGAAAGAGRGAGAKRPHSSFPMAPPPPHRGSGPAAKRLSLGGSGSANPRGRTAAPPAVEETFNLVSGNNPLAFAMIIRLAPDLVDEIRRLETQGGTARMKFDSIASGNVIDVGGKEFKFTWSRETGDLCDIYEERQSGEDGNGLLVQSGCAWRKLNVQRILDESTKIHVKMLSEEAERMRDSRRTIVLDPGNPSMKSQIKQLAAVETNPWKQHFKNKKEPPPKKRKIEPPQGGGPHKSAFKSGISSSTTVKARHSSSPVPSPPEQPGPAASPLRAINIPKSNASTEDATPKELIAKDKAASGFDKDIPSKASVSHEVIGRKSNIGSKPTDLQSMLINLLRENPKGMSLKALEKAVGDSIPNSIKQIEAILKRIATFQAPGRYLLKSEAESESLKKPSFESRSSPEENLHRTPAHEDNHNDQIPVAESDFKERVASHEFEEKEQLNLKVDEEPDAFEKLDIQQHSPDLLGERKADNSGGHAGSSSESGSDSDSESDSSDSGSDSGSPSKSRSQSPVGSRSGSSSDSDSDVSSNSKEVSDEDVDIMSDGDKEPKHKLQPDLPLSGSPVHWRSPYGRSVQDGNDDKQYEHELDIVEIEKDMSNEKPETEMVVAGISAPNQEYEKLTGKTNSSSPDPDELQQRQNFIGSLFDEGDNTLKNGSGYEQSNSPERLLQEKYKRPVEMKRSSDKSERAKRSKTGTSGQPPLSGDKDAHFQESFHKLPSDGLTEEPYKGPTNQATNGAAIEGSGERNLLKGKSHSVSGKSGADAKESGRRSMEQSAPPKASDSLKRPDNLAESLGRGLKSSERSSHLHDSLPSQKIKFHKDPVNEDGSAKEKKASRNTQEGSGGGKKSTPTDSHYKKRGESVGRFKDGGEVSGLFLTTSVKDDIKTSGDRFAVNGRGGRLQREYSDLELGELREPIPEETLANKQFEKKNSFKQSENKPGHSDNLILDMSKGKPGKVTLNLGKPSSPDLNVKVPGVLEGSNKKRNHVDRTEDLSQSQQAVVQTHSQYQARVDNVDYGPHSNRTMDAHGNSRQNGASGRLGNALEGYGESNKKAPGNQRHDTRREKVPHSLSERKRGMSNTLAELPDGQAESLLAEGNNSERKRRDSSSDENSCSYSKYEKDVPDLKGPIKDAMQYKEYVQEYNDKYDSYRSLNKILDSYRTEFEKLGKELDLAKGRDTERYYNILEQLKESYCQCGTRHKRLKKIFLVLHEELKHLKERIKDFALLYSKNT